MKRIIAFYALRAKAAAKGNIRGFRGASTLPIQKTEEGADSEPQGRTSSAPLSLNTYLIEYAWRSADIE
jgi:hypothetical protein